MNSSLSLSLSLSIYIYIYLYIYIYIYIIYICIIYIYIYIYIYDIYIYQSEISKIYIHWYLPLSQGAIHEISLFIAFKMMNGIISGYVLTLWRLFHFIGCVVSFYFSLFFLLFCLLFRTFSSFLWSALLAEVWM